MLSNTKYKTLFFLLVTVLVLLAGCKKSSIDSSLLIGKWTGLQSINRYTRNPNNTFAGIDTIALNNDTIVFIAGGQFTTSRYDTVRGVQSSSGIYSVNENTVSLNYTSTNTMVILQVISLTSHQFVFKSSAMIDPEDFVSSTVTYTR